MPSRSSPAGWPRRTAAARGRRDVGVVPVEPGWLAEDVRRGPGVGTRSRIARIAAVDDDSSESADSSSSASSSAAAAAAAVAVASSDSVVDECRTSNRPSPSGRLSTRFRVPSLLPSGRDRCLLVEPRLAILLWVLGRFRFSC